MTGFGLSFARREGGVIHPDDIIMGEMSDAQYIRQAQAYLKDTGVSFEGAGFLRQELSEQIKADVI